MGDSWVWNHSIYSVVAGENAIVARTEFEYTLFYWSVLMKVAFWDYKLLLLNLFASRTKHLLKWAFVAASIVDSCPSEMVAGALYKETSWCGVSHWAVTPRFYYNFLSHARLMNKPRVCLEFTIKWYAGVLSIPTVFRLLLLPMFHTEIEIHTRINWLKENKSKIVCGTLIFAKELKFSTNSLEIHRFMLKISRALNLLYSQEKQSKEMASPFNDNNFLHLKTEFIISEDNKLW